MNNKDIEDVKEVQEAETPLLFIDINLGEDQPERIIVYEGDQAEVLAKNFCEKHGLDDDTREKLEEQLNMQIKNVLTQIKEEEE